MSVDPLFTPFSVKSLNLKNRFVLAPISRYSMDDMREMPFD